MSLKKLSLKADARDQGKRLDQFLAERLPDALGRPLSKAKVRKLIVAGAVYLNGSRVRIASKELRPGARIDAMVDLQKLESDSTSRDRPFEMTGDRVLYEDEFLIAVDKPAGLPTQPTLDEARLNLVALVQKFVGARDGTTKPYIALHHRLDRDTSGVVLFVKDPKVNAEIGRLFSQHLARKVYRALTGAAPADIPEVANEWSVRNYLGRAPQAGKRAVFTAVRSGGDYAETDFKILERLPRGLEIEARPKTGRTHQIRVHLSEFGLPILGDSTYGQAESAPRTMLHAASLTFTHPIHKTEIAVSSALPEDYLQCLRSLK